MAMKQKATSTCLLQGLDYDKTVQLFNTKVNKQTGKLRIDNIKKTKIAEEIKIVHEKIKILEETKIHHERVCKKCK